MSETHDGDFGFDARPAEESARLTPSAESAGSANPFFRRILSVLAAGSHESATIREAQRVLSMCQMLLSERGEVSGARLAAEVLAAYQVLDTAARDAFFDLINTQFVPDRERVAIAADAYRALPSPATLVELQAAVESPRHELFRRWNLARGGTGVLIEMRRQLLKTLDNHPNRIGIGNSDIPS